MVARIFPVEASTPDFLRLCLWENSKISKIITLLYFIRETIKVLCKVQFLSLRISSRISITNSKNINIKHIPPALAGL